MELMVPAKVRPVSELPAVTVKVTVLPTLDVPELGDRAVTEPVGLLQSMAGVVDVKAFTATVLPAGSESVKLMGRALAARSVSPSAIV